MPKQVRNFWLELQVDGRETKIATGPKPADGDFSIVIRIRENGEVSDKTVHIYGDVDCDDHLRLWAVSSYMPQENPLLLLSTKR